MFENICHRSPGTTNCLVGQMTIFYCGKVNVYDGVPDAKVTKLPLCIYLKKKNASSLHGFLEINPLALAFQCI